MKYHLTFEQFPTFEEAAKFAAAITARQSPYMRRKYPVSITGSTLPDGTDIVLVWFYE